MMGLPIKNNLVIYTNLQNGKAISVYKNGKRYVFNYNNDFEGEITPLKPYQVEKLKQAIKDKEWSSVDKLVEYNMSQVE